MQTRLRSNAPTRPPAASEVPTIEHVDVELCCPAFALIADPGSEYWARIHAVDVLRMWRLDFLTAVVEPLVGEMFRNGVRHSTTQVAVTLRTEDRHIVVEVWDAGLEPPVVLTPFGPRRDYLPLTKALVERWDVVTAASGGRLVRAWIAKDVRPDAHEIEMRVQALSHHSASLLVPGETPPIETLERVLMGLRALNISSPNSHQGQRA